MGIYEHFAAKGITPVQRTGVIPSATGSGHVITCTARRWVVSGQLYCFQLPPARGRREACKPFTDPTSRITNVRINRAAAHRSKLSFGILSALPASSRLDVQKVRLRRLAIGRTKNLAERGGGVLFRRGCVKPARRTGRADKRTVFASAPLPLVSATVEAGALIFQSISGSEKRSRDRKEAVGDRRGRVATPVCGLARNDGRLRAEVASDHSIPSGRGKSCRKGVGNAVSFPRPHRP